MNEVIHLKQVKLLLKHDQYVQIFMTGIWFWHLTIQDQEMFQRQYSSFGWSTKLCGTSEHLPQETQGYVPQHF